MTATPQKPTVFSLRGAAIYSLGIGHLLPMNVVRFMECRDVRYVFDVRSPPYVDLVREQLNPDVLRPLLKSRGTAYLNIAQQAGDRPDDISLYLQKGRRLDYAKYALRPGPLAIAARLENAWSQGYRVCILGREADPMRAHRARLLGEMLYAQDILVRHIIHRGNRFITHARLRQVATLRGHDLSTSTILV